MEESIPKVPIRSRKNLPWLSKVLRKEMVKRDVLFKKYGLCNKYRNARDRVISLLRKAKSRYFHQLNPKDSKKFWKSVKYLNKKQSTIPTLQSDDVTDQEKASKLNSFFFHLILIILTSHSLPILTEFSISLIVKICIVLLMKCKIL